MFCFFSEQSRQSVNVVQVIPDCMRSELLGVDSLPSCSGQFVAPLYGPEGDFSEASHQFVGNDYCIETVKTVYVESANRPQEFHIDHRVHSAHWLVIYRAKSMWVCLLINKIEQPCLTRDFFRRVDNYLG